MSSIPSATWPMCRIPTSQIWKLLATLLFPLLKSTTNLFQSESLKVELSRRLITGYLLAHRKPRINLRWFYACVQSLLVLDIKPEFLLDGKVDRLTRRTQQQPSHSNSGNGSFSPAGSSTLGPDSSASSPEKPAPSSNNTKHVSPKAAKAKWEDDEIQLMVELKASGMRHCDVAVSPPGAP